MPGAVIPNLIHFVWIPSFQTAPRYVKENIERWEALNPDYVILKWNEPDIIKMLPSNWKAAYSSLDKDIKKADLARMVIMFFYGGAYFDCDLIPCKPLSNLLNKKKVESIIPKKDSRKRIWFPKKKEINLREKELILTREWNSGGNTPYRIANGCFLATPGNSFILEFILKSYKHTQNKVLWYMGPIALSSHVRENVESLRERAVVLSPQHFLWEGGNRPRWSISEHQGVQDIDKHWGDHTRPDYWNV